MDKPSRISGKFNVTLLGGLIAISALASRPASAHDVDELEKFSLQGVLPTETDDGAGNSGANPAATVPVKGNHVGHGSYITFKVGNGNGVFALPSGPTTPTIFDNSSPAFPGGGFCATKYGTGTITIPDNKNSSITMTLSGIGCSDGNTGLDELTWIITGGTGRYLGAVGIGRMSYGWNPAAGAAPAASILDFEGTIQRPE